MVVGDRAMTVSGPPAPAKSPARRVLEVAGSVVGIVLGVFSGINMLVPGIATGVVFFILSKTGWIKSKSLQFAAILQAGQAIWMLVGLIFIFTASSAFHYALDFTSVLEIIGYSSAVVLLVWRQAKWIVILLLAYHVFCLVVYAVEVLNGAIDHAAARALAIHILLRILAIVCMVQFLREKPKEDLVSAF